MNGTAIFQVAQEGDGLATQMAGFLTHGIDIQQCLSGMLTGTVAAVDQGMYRDIRRFLRRTGNGSAHHNRIHIAVHRLNRVLPSLALGLRRNTGVAQIDAAGTYAVNSSLEAQAGTRAGLEEQGGNGHAGQILDDFTALNALFIDHCSIHDMAQFLIAEVIRIDNVAAFKMHIGFHSSSSYICIRII